MAESSPIRIKSGERIRDLYARGDGGPALLADPGATGWEIDGFHLASPAPTDGRQAWRAVSIYVQGGSGTIRNGHFRDTAAAVYAEGMEGPLVVEGVHMAGVRWNRPRAVGIQLNGCTGGAIIDGCVSDAYLPGGIEDHITFHKCYGTAGRRFVVRNNWIRGGVGNGPAESDGNNTGCGINVGDGGGAWFDVIGNTMVLVANAAIGVSGASNARIIDNRIWGVGDKSSMTGAAVAIQPGSADIYTAGNRALVRSWQWGGKGEIGAGYWAHESVASAIETGNNWQDQTLTAGIWAPPTIRSIAMPTPLIDDYASEKWEQQAAQAAEFHRQQLLEIAEAAEQRAKALFSGQRATLQSVSDDMAALTSLSIDAAKASRAEGIARDAMVIFVDRWTATTKGETADKAMGDCVRLAALARVAAEALAGPV